MQFITIVMLVRTKQSRPHIYEIRFLRFATSLNIFLKVNKSQVFSNNPQLELCIDQQPPGSLWNKKQS